ncbi:MAG: glycosyltransferase family 4 protein [Acidobacteria bacterium]|nr:glycosyltransferase family 4 protein [Acidobacteriota bacterium]
MREAGGNNRVKILQIGNYPPPMCGWAMQTKLVIDEIRKRGYVCDVLKINENRHVKDPSYVDVQNGPDYLYKVVRFRLRGYRINVHVNGQSKKGYLLALAALLVARFTLSSGLLSFHGGLSQHYFPRYDSRKLLWAFQLLFHVAGRIVCNSEVVRDAIVAYGVRPSKITAIASFSTRYLDFEAKPFNTEQEKFLEEHTPVFFCYVSFRPEYRLDLLRQAMADFRRHFPRTGFIWLGFPEKEMPAAEKYVQAWGKDERASLLLLGNLDHDAFLSLLTRSTAYIRTPACDGVSASVLESLALGVPVIASENGTRPRGVLTYRETDVQDLCARMSYLMENRSSVNVSLGTQEKDNVSTMADWITNDSAADQEKEMSHAI